MGQGGYVFAEWSTVSLNDSPFQATFATMESQMIAKCNADWAPKTFGYFVPQAGQYGRTTIMPELFEDHDAATMTNWRQALNVTGHNLLIAGNQSAYTLSEDWKVAWLGLAFPNKQQHISEIRFQIGDRKYGRIDLEVLHAFETPALIFEEGFIIDEEQSFDLYGYVEGPLPDSGWAYIYQRIVMLGAAYYKIVDKALGDCGAAM